MATTPSGTMQNQLKRKPSAAGLATGGRTVKRRASKACHCCRSRKVRCDVVESGIPCTNCRLDEVECIVTEGKRKRKSHADGDTGHQHHNHSSCDSSVKEEKHDLPPLPIFDDIDGLAEFNPDVSSLEMNSNNALEFELNHHQPHMLYQTQGHRLTPEERSRRMSTMSARGLPTPLPIHSGVSYFPQPSRRPDIVLPQYIRPVPPRILSDDLEFLQKKGAFLIPDAGFRNELLRCYVQHVHPFLPIIDLQDFMTAVKKNEPANTVSLLLFQAVMFAGTAYIDMRYLIAQGYVTRKEARKSFFNRIKLLYDFDYETDRVTVVQATLLMTYWYDSPDDPKDVWHWLGVAISVARTIGLNCDTSRATLMSPQQRRLWKRIWWSLYMRDRLIAIGMRRPMRINDGDFDVSMLEVSDFEVDALPVELTRMLGGCPAVKDVPKRLTLAKLCVSLVKLCVCISQVLAVQYSTLGHKIGATQETTMRLVPKKSAAQPGEVLRCDQELDSWYKSLTCDLHFFAPETHERIASNDGDVVNVHRALLTGIYLTVISALHRPQILPSAPDVQIVPELRELSKRKVREAADDITELYQDLVSHDLIRYLPNTGVTCLLPAIIIHLLDIKSSNPDVRQASARKFQFCMQALQRLREMYQSADFAFSFLDAAVRKTNAQLKTVPNAALRKMAEPSQSALHGMMESMEKQSQSPGQLLLTPPPEAMQSASLLLSASTLTPSERQMIAAYTPPRSDTTLTSHTTAGAAAPLTDLDHDGLHGQTHDQHQDQHQDQENAEGLEDATHNEFESMIQLDGGHDSLLSFNDGLDMNMEWLNGFDCNDHAMTNEESFLDRLEGVEQAGNACGYAEQALDSITGDIDVDLEIRVES
ncbi:Cutinase transcription factor 1 beta [Exophiala dermatitidis]